MRGIIDQRQDFQALIFNVKSCVPLYCLFKNAIFTALDSCTNAVHDSEVAPRLIAAIQAPVRRLTGDGAYDATAVYQAAHDINALPIIPPCKGARPQKPANAIPAKLYRDVAIDYMKKLGNDEKARNQWKCDARYHCRSLAETSMYRHKCHLGSTVRSRKFVTQKTEVAIQINILNRIASLGSHIMSRADSVIR